MNLSEFERIVDICYTKKVEAITKRGKRVVLERAVTSEEIAHLVASEFGFILHNEKEETENERR